MNHLGTQTLETDRLILRKFSVYDDKDMFTNWASNPNVTKFMTWQPYDSTADVRKYIESRIAEYEKLSTYDWIIEYKANRQAIGSIGVVSLNDVVNSATIGYCLGEEYWHKGIMTEAFTAVIRFLFEEVGVNRIEATHDVNNPNSGKVMAKCGLTYEGTHRQAGLNNQGICDSAVYAYLKEDYLKKIQ